MQQHYNTYLHICKGCSKEFFGRKGRRYCTPTCFHTDHSRTLIKRFWSRVKKTDTCWLWQGYRDQNGYGQVGIGYQQQLTHRFSWELHHGPIPQGMFICHKCDNPPCVNPDHLFLGYARDNCADMMAKGRHQYGEGSYHARLTDEDVLSIRRLYATGDFTQEQLSARFGVHRATISKIILGIRWKHLL